MNPSKKNGFSILEFLITLVSLFAGLYFIFWYSYLATNYTLAQYYLSDYTFCELSNNSKHCLSFLKQRLNTLKFIEIQKLNLKSSAYTKTVSLILDYNLPLPGFSDGVKTIKLTSSINPGVWQ